MNSRRFNLFGLITLVLANGLATWEFVANNGSIIEVLWIYWLQSVIIGIINVVRILTTPLRPLNLKTTPDANPFDALLTNGPAGLLMRIGVAGFFTFHYGFFHALYAVFLTVLSNPSNSISLTESTATNDPVFTGTISLLWLMVNAAVFAVHHIFTFIIERKQLQQNPKDAPSLDEVMGRPYGRIIPMHLIIIIGPMISIYFGNSMIFIVFIILKTALDIRSFYKGTSHPNAINPAITQTII
jgi:uncharacterized protein DUF6498